MMADRCDYEAVARDFSWILQSNQQVIVSSDIDGVASAMLLNAGLEH